jgi:hypothetical protein
MQFPKGYDVTNGSFSLANSGGGTPISNGTVLVLGDANLNFKFPAVIAYQANCPDDECEMTVTNVKAPRAEMATHSIHYGLTN